MNASVGVVAADDHKLCVYSLRLFQMNVCWHSQRRRPNVADISVQVWALWIYTPETSSGVDTGGATAAVVLLCETLVHIWSSTGT